MDNVLFSKVDKTHFFRTLNKRVNKFFKERNLKKTGDWKLYSKAIFMFSLLVVPFVIILTANLATWINICLLILIGISVAGVGMNIMHDGNHESFSSKKWVNKLMGGSIYLLSGNVYNWQVQHNVLHHTFTNIKGLDEDIEAGRVIRFCHHSKWFNFNRFQKYYSIFLYGLLTLNWAVTTDFKQTYQYLKKDLYYGKKPNKTLQWATLIIGKLLYYAIWVVLPMYVLDYTWWQVLIGFLIVHYTAGMILSIIFQLAHVVPATDMPLPDEKGNMKHTWAVHQLYTTANFAPNSKIINFFTGGLNHQIEHHIFPHISHIHYHKIAKIVKETTREFGLPYNEYKTMFAAIVEHFRQLGDLGRPIHHH